MNKSAITIVTADIARRERALAAAAATNPTPDTTAHLGNFKHMSNIPQAAQPITASHNAWVNLSADSRRSMFPLMREGRLYA